VGGDQARAISARAGPCGGAVEALAALPRTHRASGLRERHRAVLDYPALRVHGDDVPRVTAVGRFGRQQSAEQKTAGYRNDASKGLGKRSRSRKRSLLPCGWPG